MPQWLVLGISGVTCGGKTTLARNLHDYFKDLRGAPLWKTSYTIGDVQLIAQDDYFLPVDDLRHKWNDKLNAINFELLTSLDMKQMLSDIAWTIKGRYLGAEPIDNSDYMNTNDTNVQYTNFEHYALQFQQQYQQQQQQQQQQLHNSNYIHGYQQQKHHHPQQQHHNQQQQQHHHHHQQQQQHHHNHLNNTMHRNSTRNAITTALRDNKINVLIIEGFMIFNQPELLALCNLKFHFHLPYEKCYERRRKRSYDPPDVTGYFEMCVWPYYEKNFSEYRDCKDITFLNGEISKEKIFKFVLQRIVNYFEERCDKACPPPQKLIGVLGSVCSSSSNTNNSSSGSSSNINGNAANTLLPKICPCPMEQQ